MKPIRNHLPRLLALFLLLAVLIGIYPLGVFAAETELTETTAEQTNEPALQATPRAVSSGLGKGTFYQYDSPTVRATNDYHNNIVGTTNGSVPNHCWDPNRSPLKTDFAICLNKNKILFAGATGSNINNGQRWAYGYVTATDTSGDESYESVWINTSQALREKLILLLCYGMDTDSSSARFGNSSDPKDANASTGATYAAMQLVAWEWIHGASEGAYTQYYYQDSYHPADVVGRAAELRNLVATNPDHIDTSQTKICIVWPTTNYQDSNGTWRWGQCLIAIDQEPVYKVTTSGFTLAKSIDASDTCIAQIKDNPLYSLAGAQYQVMVDGTVTETLTTDANGYATSSKEYEIGTTVTVKETVAPSGFKLDTTAYTFTIQDGGNTISVKDEPLFDPPFALTKVDKDTTNAQGNGSFNGAVFKWEYFTNYDWSGTPLKTWYLVTDEYGVIRYDSRYCAAGYSSEQFYYGNSGAPQLPLGSVKITEIKNSLGYVVLPQALKCTIVKDTATDSAKYVWDAASLAILRDFSNGNFGVPEPIDTSLFGSLTVEKIDAASGGTPQSAATLEGAKFQVINNSTNSVKIGDFAKAQPGEVCYEFTTDAAGRYSTGNIFPLGSYTVEEVSPPTGYLLNESWSQSFTVTETARDFSFTAENGSACADNIILGSVRIVKKDILLGDGTGADAFLDGIAFNIVSENDNPVVVNGVTYLKGQTVLTLSIQWDGSRWTAESGNVLPYGNYTIAENVNASGTANDYYEWNSETALVAIRGNGTTTEVCFTNSLRPGELTIRKVNVQGEPLAGVKFLLEWSKDGENWTPVSYSEAEHPTVGTCNTADLEDGCLTTGENGTVSFTMLHPGLQYRVTEVETLPGYQLAAEPVFTGTLPNNTLNVILELTNGQVYVLPQTGAFGMKTVWILFAMLLGSVAILLGTYKRKD